MARVVHIEIEQASTFSKDYTALSGTGVGTPINLSGYTVRAECKKSYTTFAAFPFTAVITDAVNGGFTLSMTDIQTRDLPPGRMIYDVRIIDANGVATRIIEGIIEVNPAITDANPYATSQGTKIMDPEVVHKHTNKDILDLIVSASQIDRKWRVVESGSPVVTEFNAINGDRLCVNTSANSIDIVVPDAPTEDYSLEVLDDANTFGINSVRVITNSSPAQILYTCNTSGKSFRVVYIVGRGWKVIA